MESYDLFGGSCACFWGHEIKKGILHQILFTHHFPCVVTLLRQSIVVIGLEAKSMCSVIVRMLARISLTPTGLARMLSYVILAKLFEIRRPS